MFDPSLLITVPVVALALATSLFAAEPAGAGGKDADQYIQVEIKGKLEAGIVAIGGETTGYAIRAKGASWELDFANNQESRRLADSLGGKTVIVKGSFEIRKGVEIKQRQIVTVSSLKEAAK
jgi:hypothetical protein